MRHLLQQVRDVGDICPICRTHCDTHPRFAASAVACALAPLPLGRTKKKGFAFTKPLSNWRARQLEEERGRFHSCNGRARFLRPLPTNKKEGLRNCEALVQKESPVSQGGGRTFASMQAPCRQHASVLERRHAGVAGHKRCIALHCAQDAVACLRGIYLYMFPGDVDLDNGERHVSIAPGT